MKKQLIFVTLISFWSCEIFASLTPGQQKVLRENPGRVINGMTWNGSAIVSASGNTVVPSGDGNNNAGGNTVVPTGGNAVVTRAELEDIIEKDLKGSISAAYKALEQIGPKPANNPNQRVLNYIMG